MEQDKTKYWQKGKVIMGHFGVGKTTSMKEIQKASKDQNRWVSTSQVCHEVQTYGGAALNEYVKTAHLFIDDLGSQSESATVLFYQTPIEPILKLIEDRYNHVVHTHHTVPGCQLRMGWNSVTKKYERHPKSYFATYITTNLSADQLEEKYGKPFVDRLFEMCEFEKMEGDSKRQ